MKKLISITLLSLMLISGGLMGGNLSLAENSISPKQNITYVAFGDSIAEGYAINLKTKTASETLITGADENYSFVENSYAGLIKAELDKDYITTGYNFSYSGDTCQDLIDYLAEFYDYESGLVKNGNENNATYPSLTNSQIYESVSNANIITICIGANNVLSKASELITGFLGLNESKTQTITQNDMEETCKDYILGNESKNIKGFKAEFNELLKIFNKLNPNAKIYFTNVFNPYKVLDANSNVLSLASIYSPALTQANLNIISKTTEIVIGGGKSSKNEDYIGINNVIESEINAFNLANNSNNFILVNSKPLFDQKFNNSSTETRKVYNNYVNTRLDELTTSNIINLLGDVNNMTSTLTREYIDPHPTKQGHELLFNAHKTAGLEVYLPITKITISFETNCEISLQSQILNIGSKIEKPQICREKYTLVGWFTDPTFENEWNFNNEATNDMTLYAKWEENKPLPALTIFLSIVGIVVATLSIAVIITLRNRRNRAF